MAGSDNFYRCDKTLGEVQSEIVNLQARTSRIERSLAQVFDQMKQMEQLNKTMMERVHAMFVHVTELYGAGRHMIKLRTRAVDDRGSQVSELDFDSSLDS